jgi:hypothetical protein
VVILNTVNVRGSTYHSASEDTSLGTSNSSHDTKTGASISSSSSSYGTAKFYDTIMETGGGGQTEYGTIQFHGGGDEYGTIQFHETAKDAYDTVRLNVEAYDSDTALRSTRTKRPLSSSLGNTPSPQVLSETDESNTDTHRGDDEALSVDETPKGNEATPKGIANVVKHPTLPGTTKETRSIGVQTDLPLDLYAPPPAFLPSAPCPTPHFCIISFFFFLEFNSFSHLFFVFAI